jgi:dephospho-CoA kinase
MGKSSVLGMFGELGAFTISADTVVAGLLEEGPVLEKVREIFGPFVFDAKGRLIKDRVARIIFMDEKRRKALEGLLHPLVFERVEKALEGVDEKIAVVEIPLLYEGGYEKKFTRTITVYADYTTVLRRLEQEGITKEDILMRHCCQMPVQDKIRRSDFSINNNDSRDETLRQVREIYDSLLAGA